MRCSPPRARARASTRAVRRADRYLDKTARKYETAIKSVASHNAFNMKYEHGTKYGAGGILGGDNVRTPEPAQVVPRRTAPVSSPGGKPRAGASGGGGSSALTQSESLSPAGKARGGASGSAKGLGRKYVEPKSGDASPAHKKRAPLAHDADPIRLSFPGAKPPPPAAAFAWPHKPTSWIPDPNAKYGHYRSSA